MVKLIIISFSFFLLLAQSNNDLEIRISGVDEAQGAIMVAVYQAQHEFLSEGGYLFEKIDIEKSGELSLYISLPDGKYAISVYHDLNSDGELNTNLLGIPKEPYGFSISRGSFGPPSFEEASFLVPSRRHISIEIR